MQSTLLLGCFLATLGLSHPAAPSELIPRAPNITTPPSNLLNPWGPDDFSISILHRSQPFSPSQFFRTAVGVVSELSQMDFNSMLARHRMDWYDISAPSLAISVSSMRHTDRLPLRYVLWAIARLWQDMVRTNEFRTSVSDLKWQGAKVGTMAVINYRLEQPGGIAENTTTLANDPTAAPNAWISFQYRFHGSLLTTADVYMGAIGALIQSAEFTSAMPPGQNIDRFEGGFPPYQAKYFFKAEVTPSKLNRLDLVASIVVATIYASKENDWRELELNTTMDGEVVSRGGYRRAGQVVGVGTGGGGDVSTS